MKKVLVLGAGMISRPLVRYLLDQPDFYVTMATIFFLIFLGNVSTNCNLAWPGPAIIIRSLFHFWSSFPTSEKNVCIAPLLQVHILILDYMVSGIVWMYHCI